MTKNWQNWSGSVEATPARIEYPTTQAEIVRFVQQARASGRNVRVVGSGHSFTPLVQTDGVLLSLDNYTGITAVDPEKLQVTVRAGTKIRQLGDELFSYGLAQPNLGDIDVQSIAGAISTGTHGTGATLGNISTQVVGLTLVTGTGEVITCSESQNRDIFKAAQIGLGALGVITDVTLHCVPAYRLHYEWRKISLSDALDNYDNYRRRFRNFEFYWLPYTDACLAKFIRATEENSRPKNFYRRFNETVLENGVFWLLSEFCRRFPDRSASVARLVGKLISGGSDVQYSHRIYATTRLVKFQEMEYNLPVENFGAALREIDECIRRERFEVHFPLECRFTAADDIWLSPAHGRQSAYIAVHMYKGMEYQRYFAAVEAILRAHGGRPHWGKLHTLTAPDFAALYPCWEQFQSVRRTLDPDGVFLNSYLKTIFTTEVTEGKRRSTEIFK
jgi:FAD-linked oxidoreductase